ncbi:MAG: hypothetical protein GF364_09735 [Candidatus Lokiarchaeota archaeon]|nr:hypothetical protein [Candidatus Lokiarchaeota archaeon]
MEDSVFQFFYGDYIGEFDNFFMAIGYDELLATATPLGKANFQIIKNLNAGIKYVRSHNMFTGPQGDGRGIVDAGCNPIEIEHNSELKFNWDKMDRVYDVWIENGFTPYVEFGFMPPEFTTADAGAKYPWKYPPKNYNHWRTLIRECVAHFKERYPNEIDDFIWEVWNEPNKFLWMSGYFEGSADEYCKLYDYTLAGMYDVFPEGNFRIGGPALAGHWFPFLKKFLNHCLYGENHATGDIGAKLDYVSYHLKGGAYFNTPNMKKIIKNLRKHMKFLKKFQKGGRIANKHNNSAYLPDDVEIHITEMDPVVGCARGIDDLAKLEFRNTAYYPTFICYMATLFHYIRCNENYNIKWVFSDNVHFGDEAAKLRIFSGCRSLTTAPFNANKLEDALQEDRIIAKPMLKSFQFLNEMQGKALNFSNREDYAKKYVRNDVTCLCCISDDANVIKLLISNLNPKFTDEEKKKVTISIENLPSVWDSVKCEHVILDTAHDNTYSAWINLGKPLQPTTDQLQTIKEKEALSIQKTGTLPVEDGILSQKISVNPHSINYIKFKKR